MSSLPARIAMALGVPWHTSYTAPVCMALSGVVYALRGYEVTWSEPCVSWSAKDQCMRQDPSSIAYTVFRKPTKEGRMKSHGVVIDCVFPDKVVLAEYKIRNGLRHAVARVASGVLECL